MKTSLLAHVIVTEPWSAAIGNEQGYKDLANAIFVAWHFVLGAMGVCFERGLMLLSSPTTGSIRKKDLRERIWW